MNLSRKLIKAIYLFYFAISSLNVRADELACLPPVCGPCGKEVITNLPIPSYGECSVHPLQNYLATSLNCDRVGRSGIYLGTGFGYGAINLRLSIPGLNFVIIDNSIVVQSNSTLVGTKHSHTSNYVIEYATIGYSNSMSNFFFGAEFGYYYNSVTRPIFFDDPSIFLVVPASRLPFVVSTTPCTVRLNIDGRNHVAFDLLPGFGLSSRWALFGRLGVEYTSFSWRRRVCFPRTFVRTSLSPPFFIIDVNDPVIAANLFDHFFGDIDDSQTASAVGFRLGAGAAFAAGPHLSFTVNAVHIAANRVHFTPDEGLVNQNFPLVFQGGVPVVAVLGGDRRTLLATNTINPTRNEILFGIMIFF